MKKILSILFYLLINTSILSQNVDFIEYDLDNGLHVILHQDKSVPLAVTSVMYHVGSKDDSLIGLVLHTSLNIFYLKGQKISAVVSSIRLLIVMVVLPMHIPQMMKRIILNFSF